MKVFIAALALFCFCEARPGLKPEQLLPKATLMTEPYIVGGSSVSISSYPYQISLQFSSGSHTCGGSIMSSTKIANAAHCTQSSASSYRIRAGSSDRTRGGQVRSVAFLVNHPSYCPSCTGFPNDVSVITLSSPLSLGGSVQTISLSSSDSVGSTCTITGWGRTSSSNSLPVTLQGANISILSTSDCASRMSALGNNIINSYHICIYDYGRRAGACNGDSGGPLNCGGRLSGIASWVVQSSGSCRQDFPSVYARVSYFRNWLLSN